MSLLLGSSREARPVRRAKPKARTGLSAYSASREVARNVVVLALAGWLALWPVALSAQESEEGPSVDSAGPAFSPEIWSAPDPSRLVVRGRCLPGEGDPYRLVVEYETDGAARYRALLIFAEPSHRLLFLQWNGPPDHQTRAAIHDTPLVLFERDAQRRHATFPFRPGGDDRLLVQVLTLWGERRDALRGRVADLCDFAVENRVHD